MILKSGSFFLSRGEGMRGKREEEKNGTQTVHELK